MVEHWSKIPNLKLIEKKSGSTFGIKFRDIYNETNI